MAIDANGNVVMDTPLGIGYGQPIKTNNMYGIQYQPGVTTDANAIPKAVDDINLPINSVVTNGNNSGLAGASLWDRFKNSFTPEGASGRSYAGNIMDFAGTGVGIGTGLAAMYYNKKNSDLQQDDQNRRNAITARAASAGNQAAANVGNGASYTYSNILGK